ncbi:winged helix-turn-helix transcriptional regulator [Methanorbis rubei]|uniref:Winged helix-turn-helix transcriptional regulator n=1 Tax=Methanorbis rubei TaxID=3028300 RepID=A0AAE4MF99_9EURY|nr:hypothetical protein [Methanocorpusculaceae archaeon Cs1]
MSTKQTAVLLILFLGIFAAVLIFVPSEIPQTPEEIVVPAPAEIPQQMIDTKTVIKSYGTTWNERGDRYDHDYDVYLMWEWFNNDTTFDVKVQNHYGNNSPIHVIFYGESIGFGVYPSTTVEEMDMIYEWLNESASEAGLWRIPAKFRYFGKLMIGPAPTVVRTPEYNTVIQTYGATWEEIWEREGKEYDYGRVWSWYYNNTNYQGEFWESVENYYGDVKKSPINRIEYGWTITVWTDPISLTEMDQVYEKINRSMAKEGLWGIPVQFKYGEKFIAGSENYTVYITGHLTSGLTLTAEKDSIVRTRPQQNHLKSFLLILLTAVVAVVGFFRILELPSDPESRPQRIAKFIEAHPGCSQKEIIDATGYSRGSVLYNLKLLKQKKIVQEDTYYGTIRYFSREANTSAMERMFHTILDQEKPARVLRAIAESPGISDAELAEKISVAKTTLAWHLGRFADAGIVMKTKEGSTLTPEALDVWQQLAEEPHH